MISTGTGLRRASSEYPDDACGGSLYKGWETLDR